MDKTDSTIVSTNRLISEGITIAMVPIYGYALGFLYELGKANYYLIPNDLVSVSIPQSFLAIGKVILIAIFAAILLNMLLLFKKSTPDSDGTDSIFKSFGPLLFIVFSEIYLFRFDWHEYWFFMFGALTFTLPILLILLQHKISRKHINWKEYANNIGRGIRFTDWLSRLLGYSRVVLFMWVAAILYVSYLSGRAEGVWTQYYFVQQDEPDQILLATYGNTYIFERADLKLKRFTGVITVSKIRGGVPLQLIYKRIGHIENKLINSEQTAQSK